MVMNQDGRPRTIRKNLGQTSASVPGSPVQQNSQWPWPPPTPHRPYPTQAPAPTANQGSSAPSNRSGFSAKDKDDRASRSVIVTGREWDRTRVFDLILIRVIYIVSAPQIFLLSLLFIAFTVVEKAAWNLLFGSLVWPILACYTCGTILMTVGASKWGRQIESFKQRRARVAARKATLKNSALSWLPGQSETVNPYLKKWKHLLSVPVAEKGRLPRSLFIGCILVITTTPFDTVRDITAGVEGLHFLHTCNLALFAAAVVTLVIPTAERFLSGKSA